MKITLEEAMELLRRWANERPEGAKYPRVAGNPYGDNTVGVAFDEGWWECFRQAKELGWFTPPGPR